jgi:hypothetical protein
MSKRNKKYFFCSLVNFKFEMSENEFMNLLITVHDTYTESRYMARTIPMDLLVKLTIPPGNFQYVHYWAPGQASICSENIDKVTRVIDVPAWSAFEKFIFVQFLNRIDICSSVSDEEYVIVYSFTSYDKCEEDVDDLNFNFRILAWGCFGGMSTLMSRLSHHVRGFFGRFSLSRR